MLDGLDCSSEKCFSEAFHMVSHSRGKDVFNSCAAELHSFCITPDCIASRSQRLRVTKRPHAKPKPSNQMQLDSRRSSEQPNFLSALQLHHGNRCPATGQSQREPTRVQLCGDQRPRLRLFDLRMARRIRGSQPECGESLPLFLPDICQTKRRDGNPQVRAQHGSYQIERDPNRPHALYSIYMDFSPILGIRGPTTTSLRRRITTVDFKRLQRLALLVSVKRPPTRRRIGLVFIADQSSFRKSGAENAAATLFQLQHLVPQVGTGCASTGSQGAKHNRRNPKLGLLHHYFTGWDARIQHGVGGDNCRHRGQQHRHAAVKDQDLGTRSAERRSAVSVFCGLERQRIG